MAPFAAVGSSASHAALASETHALMLDSPARSLVKAVSWRLFGTLATALIVLVLTRRAELALLAGAFDVAVKIALYFVHERLWDRISFGRKAKSPVVVWLTGLSGAGKTTVALHVVDDLRRRGCRVEHLDGDTIREVFPETGFSRAERDAHVRRVGYLASKLESHGVYVVVSLISPYRESRDFVRGLCKQFIEVHVATPLEECERRDVKGLYARARRGELVHFTGVDDPYEPPRQPELSYDTHALSATEARATVLARIDEYGKTPSNARRSLRSRQQISAAQVTT
jgi:adenylylsulfate kinase